MLFHIRYFASEPVVEGPLDFQLDVRSDFAFDFVVYPGGNAYIIQHTYPAEDLPRQQVARYRYVDDSRIDQGLFEGGQLTFGEGEVEAQERPRDFASEFLGICDDFAPGVLCQGLPVHIFELFEQLAHRLVQHREDKDNKADCCNHIVCLYFGSQYKRVRKERRSIIRAYSFFPEARKRLVLI